MAAAISMQAWNRTLLARQHLLERVEEDAIDVLDRCVGMQSQDPQAAFFGLAARIVDFDPAELNELMTDRDVVRMALLRSTVWLMDAEDARWIRPLAQQSLQTELTRYQLPKLTGDVSVDSILDVARELLQGNQISGSELGMQLASRWPSEKPTVLTAIARCGLPLVQVPPRGLWRGSGVPTYALFDDWVGTGDPALTGDEAVRDLIRLYLRGFGPASAAGMQAWAGRTRLGPVMDAMEADWELNKFDGPNGETLYDIDGLDIVDDSDAPVRFLAPFDNILVAQAGDRRRVLDDDVFEALKTPNGRFPGTVLVDGRVAASWTVNANGVVEVSYLRDVPASRRKAAVVESETVAALFT